MLAVAAVPGSSRLSSSLFSLKQKLIIHYYAASLADVQRLALAVRQVARNHGLHDRSRLQENLLALPAKHPRFVRELIPPHL